jgi:hypothetical protein
MSDGFIAIVSGESSDWAHWTGENARQEMEDAAKTHLREHLWSHHKHISALTSMKEEELIRSIDFRVYKVGPESYRVALPWWEWTVEWWEYRQLLRRIEATEKEIKVEKERVDNYLDTWANEEGEGLVMDDHEDQILEAHRVRREKEQLLQTLKDAEKKY